MGPRSFSPKATSRGLPDRGEAWGHIVAIRPSRAFEANGLEREHRDPDQLRAKPDYTVNLVADMLVQLADDLRAFSLGTIKLDAAKLYAAYAAKRRKPAARKVKLRLKLSRYVAARFVVRHLEHWTKVTQQIAECMPKTAQQSTLENPLMMIRHELAGLNYYFQDRDPQQLSRGELCESAARTIDQLARAWADDIEAAANALGAAPHKGQDVGARIDALGTWRTARDIAIALGLDLNRVRVELLRLAKNVKGARLSTAGIEDDRVGRRPDYFYHVPTCRHVLEDLLAEL